MSESTQLVPIAIDDPARPARLHSPEISIRRKEEALPFTISVVREEVRLEKAVSIRYAAYARHVPAFAAKLTEPEPNDRDAGSILLLAESKLDGTPVGTMRIQTNRYKPLAIEGSVKLPENFHGATLSEATRLGIGEGRIGNVAKIALFKAYYLCCIATGIDWMVIAARPPLDRQYEALLFDDLFPGEMKEMRHGNNIPHRVLTLKVGRVEPTWRETGHKLYDYFFRTNHPDIDVSGVESGRQGGEVDQTESLRIIGLKA
jgi:hypothetical protein